MKGCSGHKGSHNKTLVELRWSDCVEHGCQEKTHRRANCECVNKGVDQIGNVRKEESHDVHVAGGAVHAGIP